MSFTDKFTELARWHLNNNNCKQVLLGVSHDAGYAPFLDEVLRDEITRKRITVLEGVPTHRELILTGVNIFRMGNDIFRCDKLIDRSVPPSVDPSPKAVSAMPVITPSATPPASVAAPSPFSSFAAIAQKSRPATPPPQISVPLAPRSVSLPKRPKEQPAQQKWNPGPRGFDKPIAVVATVLDAVKKRKDNNKLCNNHFLRGPCSKGDSCTFVHNYKPTPDEIDAIAFLTRLNPCTAGQDCDSDECIYGHHVS